MQAMPGGAINAGFGRFFIGVQLANTGAAAWPITHRAPEPALAQRERLEDVINSLKVAFA